MSEDDVQLGDEEWRRLEVVLRHFAACTVKLVEQDPTLLGRYLAGACRLVADAHGVSEELPVDDEVL